MTGQAIRVIITVLLRPMNLTKLKELAERATPGPWEVEHLLDMKYDNLGGPCDAYFILELAAQFPSILAYIESAEKLVETLKQQNCPCCVKCYSDAFAEQRDSALDAFNQETKGL